MTVTFVSAFVDLQEDRSTEKSIERYLSLLDTLTTANIRLHVFVSPIYLDRIHVKNGIVEPIELAALNAFAQAPQDVPDHRTTTKDTRNYLILMNSKVELVKRAIDSGKHNSSHYAWIDAGICHVFKNPSRTLEYLSLMDHYDIPNSCMFVPGCADAVHTSFDIIDWRFCGGFFLGDAASIQTFYEFYERFYASLPKLTWEVNIWAFFEANGWNPTWYSADHDDSIVRIPVQHTVMRIPKNPGVFWYGDLSKCYEGGAIESYLKESVERQSAYKQILFAQSDGLDGPRYDELKAIAPNAIIPALCTRDLNAPDILLLPLDDDSFRYGLLGAMPSYRIVPWEMRLPVAFWRGGTSGSDSMTIRRKVVEKLLPNSSCDVRFTRGVSAASDAAVPDEYFAPHRVAIEQHFAYKYILIVDGNVIASSHQWVFGSGSVPIMVTHPGNGYWFQKYLEPMKNYVPVSYDLSDLDEKIEWLVAHDVEAREIADNALRLARTVLSSEFQKKYIDDEVQRIVKRNPTIGVAIPCYKPHIPNLKACLDSIEAQTTKPDDVVVVCSSTEPTDIPSDWNYTFPLRIITRSDRRNAAQNRNEAASHLNTDFISFFDGDDIMYTNRIESVKTCDVDILLHAFSETDKCGKEPSTYLRNILARAPSGCAVCVTNYTALIHHAHVTCRRSILEHVRFHEEPEYERREDAVFCGDVLARKNITSVYIPQPLSLYIMQGVTLPSI
jgi:hypothetical protein